MNERYDKRIRIETEATQVSASKMKDCHTRFKVFVSET